MFYLGKQVNISKNREYEKEDEFGWYLDDGEMIEDNIYKDLRFRFNGKHKSLTKITERQLKTISILTCCNEDEKSSNASIPRERTCDNLARIENIEMNPLRIEISASDSQEIDLKMIENDADRGVSISSTSSMENEEIENESGEERSGAHSRGFSYTPERLIRSQEYRILTPSPRYLTVSRGTLNGNNYAKNKRNDHCNGHERKIGDLIDSKKIGATHLESLLDPGAPEIRLPVGNRQSSSRCRSSLKVRMKSREKEEEDCPSEFDEPLEIANRESPIAFETPDLVSSRSSYERLNGSWDDAKSKIVRGSSQDDTSGIQSNEWSTADTPSDTQTPVCLCHELATASPNFTNFQSKNRCTTINEVVSILKKLESDPDLAAETLGENRFCDVTSSHDDLTRLALAIEPDGSVPIVRQNPQSLLLGLCEKVEKLQETSRNILKDIDLLRRDFECNETKVDNLIEQTVTLRHDSKEVRYLDDLLNLLDGELERISKRNWPFVFGHSDFRAEEMNLVV